MTHPNSVSFDCTKGPSLGSNYMSALNKHSKEPCNMHSTHGCTCEKPRMYNKDRKLVSWKLFDWKTKPLLTRLEYF